LPYQFVCKKVKTKINLKLGYPFFLFTNYIKCAFDRKICSAIGAPKLAKRALFDEVIAKIKW